MSKGEIVCEGCGQYESECRCRKPKPEVCSKCHGSGLMNSWDEHIQRLMAGEVTCPRCKGTGIKPDEDRLLSLERIQEIAVKKQLVVDSLNLGVREQRDLTASHYEGIFREIWDKVICPMCYRLNPQHKTMDNGAGCHWCQDMEDWTGKSLQARMERG